MVRSASTPLQSTPSVCNLVEGGEEDEMESMAGAERQVVKSKSVKKRQAAERALCQPNASGRLQDSSKVGVQRSCQPAALKKRVIAALHIRELPSTHRKIVRPPDGLDLRKTSCYGISTVFLAAGITAIQACTDWVCPNVVRNIIVVCTKNEDKARKILALKSIRLNEKEQREVVMYAATEGNYVKGGICNIERDIGEAELARLIVHQRNATVRKVKGINDTGSIVVLFDGEDVPSYIKGGQAIVQYYRYKKQIEVCSKCTRVGHRADVCPTLLINAYHNCGAKDPKQGPLYQKQSPQTDTFCYSTEAKGKRNGTCFRHRPVGFPHSSGRAAWAVFKWLAAALHHRT
ncbi:hypothetical protein HPB51_007744 [Rhipicephalus microplus]|uniref:CCHC-type domain-containing protein n=1 Tax=Rhipicephalus microplus TaxID=6941 RepID=A0A9J6DTB3_RHIMP|nr:hypothetical protein HPB51_007744 [Rhipicephalus microplus]